VAHMEDEVRCIQGLVGKPEGSRQRGRPRRRWEDNINIYVREIGCGREVE
jgi:hypothetical protein